MSNSGGAALGCSRIILASALSHPVDAERSRRRFVPKFFYCQSHRRVARDWPTEPSRRSLRRLSSGEHRVRSRGGQLVHRWQAPRLPKFHSWSLLNLSASNPTWSMRLSFPQLLLLVPVQITGVCIAVPIVSKNVVHEQTKTSPLTPMPGTVFPTPDCRRGSTVSTISCGQSMLHVVKLLSSGSGSRRQSPLSRVQLRWKRKRIVVRVIAPTNWS